MPIKYFTPRTLLAAAFFSLVVVVPFLPFAYSTVTQTAAGEPLTLSPPPHFSFKDLLVRSLPVFGGCLVALWCLARPPKRLRETAKAGRAWCIARPQRAVALCALAAVMASSYPVIFLGKSFVSPNVGATLLYGSFPTLPGYIESRTMNTMASDVGALMWQHLPMSMFEHRALFRDHELPLWNRYNSTGFVLLGQGQSMFGDPLHMILPVLFDGAAWAWDIKYLAAKWLLALGLGLAVWHGTRHLPSALIVAFTSDFVGFFLERINHPAFFAFCYAPWILYCWMRATGAPTLRTTACWTGGLMLANGMEMTSGTAKEAYMLLLTLNLTGALMLALNSDSWRRRFQRLAILIWGGILFALLSAPIWLTFANALKQALTGYDIPVAYQIEPSMLIGLFDEIFYRPFNVSDTITNPSANFVLLLGLMAFLVYLRHTVSNRLALAVALGALVPLAFSFGFVPALWISRIPLLRNVIHVDDSFACGLIIQIAVLAGFGFHAAAERLGRPEGRFDVVIGLLLLFGLIFAYLGFTQVVLRGPYSYLSPGQVIHRSPFVWASLVVLPAAAVGLMLLCRRMLAQRSASPAAVILVLTFAIVLLWRHGLQAGSGFPDYTTHFPLRVNFHAKSPAVETVRADRAAPFRAVGFENNLSPGWTGVYGLEGINGPDALVDRQYREFVLASGLDVIWGWRIVVHTGTLAALKPIYDFLNVKYYFDNYNASALTGTALKPVVRSDLNVYRSDTPWPRAFFTDQVWRYRNLPDLLADIDANPGRPFAAVEVGQQEVPARLFAVPDLSPRVVVPAHGYRLTTNRTSFEVAAPGPGVIVLQEAWMRRDFKVTLNGAPVSYFRVNHAFKGIVVDRAGTYRVSFAYWPRDLSLSLALAAAGMIGVAGSAWLAWPWRPKGSGPEFCNSTTL